MQSHSHGRHCPGTTDACRPDRLKTDNRIADCNERKPWKTHLQPSNPMGATNQTCNNDSHPGKSMGKLNIYDHIDPYCHRCHDVSWLPAFATRLSTEVSLWSTSSRLFHVPAPMRSPRTSQPVRICVMQCAAVRTHPGLISVPATRPNHFETNDLSQPLLRPKWNDRISQQKQHKRIAESIGTCSRIISRLKSRTRDSRPCLRRIARLWQSPNSPATSKHTVLHHDHEQSVWWPSGVLPHHIVCSLECHVSFRWHQEAKTPRSRRSLCPWSPAWSAESPKPCASCAAWERRQSVPVGRQQHLKISSKENYIKSYQI